MIKNLLFFLKNLSSKWMNPRAKGKEQYNPTNHEHYANIITHAFAIVPSIVAVSYMISFTRSHAQYRSTLIYGTSLIMLFSVSTLFHFFSYNKKFRLVLVTTSFAVCDFCPTFCNNMKAFVMENFFPLLR